MKLKDLKYNTKQLDIRDNCILKNKKYIISLIKQSCDNKLIKDLLPEIKRYSNPDAYIDLIRDEYV